MRHFANLLMAGFGFTVLGCTDRGSSPTSPDFAPSVVSCDLSTARGLVNSIFPNAQRTPVKNLLQTIQDAGVQTEAATNAGFDLLALIAAYGSGSPQDRSAFVNAIITCQNVGTVSPSLPIDFTGALGTGGAFAVRGGLDTNKAAVVSHDGAWGLEPPLNLTATPVVRYTWDKTTVGPNPFNPASNPSNKRFLAYGVPISDSTFPTGFTSETLVGTIFEWFTIPTLTFEQGVVVGTCINDGSGSEYLIQHNAATTGGEIVPSATPSFCGGSSSASRDAGWSPFALARKVLNLFRPEPLLAAALGTRPPGGSIGSLSPSAAVNPGLIKLAFGGLVADGKTGVPLQFKGTPPVPVSVNVSPARSTPMDGVHVRLIATTNLGATVVASGNTATTQNGIATFPDLRINKAGGYRLIATLDGFGQNSTAGYKFNNVTSNGFNLKQSR